MGPGILSRPVCKIQFRALLSSLKKSSVVKVHVAMEYNSNTDLLIMNLFFLVRFGTQEVISGSFQTPLFQS